MLKSSQNFRNLNVRIAHLQKNIYLCNQNNYLLFRDLDGCSKTLHIPSGMRNGLEPATFLCGEYGLRGIVMPTLSAIVLRL